MFHQNKITLFMKTTTQQCQIAVAFLIFFFCGTGKVASQSNYDYTEVLTKSIQFYDAQICGPQPSWSRATWRNDCHMNDGSDINKNLTGGWHDAGDHTKFNYVSAQATRVLAWSYLEYPKSFNDTNNRTALLRHLRLSGDFMVKLHPSPNVFYAQIGRAKTGNNPEHNEWVPPSQQSARIDRSVTQINTNNPGTAMACANAAAFASLAMVFEDEDPDYSAEMLQHAIDLYNFGDTYRGDHYDRLEGEPYPTNDFTDDLLVGAIWLYKATGDQAWLDKALGLFPSVEFNTGWTMHYRDHQYEGFLLLAQIIREQRYYDAVERWIDNEIDNAPRSDAGLYYRTDFLAASFAQAMAFGAYYYADLRGDNFSKSSKYKDFAFRQIGYVLGDNPRNSSYMSGFGNNFPKRIHHRGASGVAQDAQVDDKHELTGALCGGPKQDDSWSNQRTDVKGTEPAISNQAFFVGMAAMVLKENGTTPVPVTEGTIEIENNFDVVNDTGENNSVAVDATNPGASNGKYVRLFDTNDELSTTFTVSESGDYKIDLRVRTGEESANSTSNLASKYEIRIDGTVRSFQFVSGSASDLDNDTYWGDLTRTQNLSAGSHTVRIKAKANWLKADRLKFMLTAPQSFTDEITSISAPGSVTQGETATVAVDYSSSTNRDIVVYLQYDGDPNFQVFRTVRRDVAAGTGSLNIDIPVPSDLPVGNNLYQIQVFIAKDGGNWGDAISSMRRKDVNCLAPQSFTDEITSISAPGSVTQGGTATVAVDYSSSTNRDIVVYLQYDGDPNFQVFRTVRRDVAAGTGSLNIDIPVPSDLPVGNNLYQIQVFIAKDGGNWGDAISSMRRKDVNCLAAGSSARTSSALDQAEKFPVRTSSEIVIYPNPATEGSVTVTGPERYNIEVVNLAGKSVFIRENASRAEQLNLAGLPAGMYMFKIYDQKASHLENRKVIIR